jgi:hypothetical protein
MATLQSPATLPRAPWWLKPPEPPLPATRVQVLSLVSSVDTFILEDTVCEAGLVHLGVLCFFCKDEDEIGWCSAEETMQSCYRCREEEEGFCDDAA